MQYILLTRWPHTQYIFPNLRLQDFRKYDFQGWHWLADIVIVIRIIIIIVIVIYVIIVVTSVRIRWYFVIFNRLSKRLKSISKFGMWDFEYCRHSVYSKIDKCISLSLSRSVHASSGSLPTLLIDSLKVALGASLFKQFEHLSRYANAFLRMQLMPTAQLMMPSLYLPAKCPLGIALSLAYKINIPCQSAKTVVGWGPAGIYLHTIPITCNYQASLLFTVDWFPSPPYRGKNVSSRSNNSNLGGTGSSYNFQSLWNLCKNQIK